MLLCEAAKSKFRFLFNAPHKESLILSLSIVICFEFCFKPSLTLTISFQAKQPSPILSLNTIVYNVEKWPNIL